MQGSASLSLCARRQPKRWWVVQWKNSESTDILEVVFQVAQENENHLKRFHSNDSIDLLTYYDGFLETQLSGMRVPFHVIRSDSTPWDAKQAYSLALLGARMSCDAIDIFRGRQKPAHVERILTEDCMRRLKIAASIIGHYMKEDANLYAKIGLLPINVSAINGWLTSTTKFECAALLNIGETRLRCNTAFRLKGSTWKCVLADFG